MTTGGRISAIILVVFKGLTDVKGSGKLVRSSPTGHQRKHIVDLIRVFHQFPDHESCLEHLEKVRWGDAPHCPRCNSEKVTRKADGERVGRWNCYKCKSSFNVLSKTIFQKTRIPLQKWFLAVAILLNTENPPSSCQLALVLDLNQKSAWFLKTRIQNGMDDPDSFLYFIFESDKTSANGKPRKSDRNSDDLCKHDHGKENLIVASGVVH